MNKKRNKTMIICCIAAFALIAAAVLARILLLYFGVLEDEEFSEQKMDTTVEEITKENEYIDYREKDGLIYLNNELLVTAQPDAEEKDVTALAKKVGATVDSSMADIGIYRFVFSKSLSEEELEKKIETIEKEDFIEEVQLSIVSVNESDAAEKKEFEQKDPAFPNDRWGGDDWNAVAGGNNWGMEAVEAPGAWGYRDQMSDVKIGLIDSMPDTDHEDLKFAATDCIFIDSKTGKTETNTHELEADEHGSHVAGIMSAEWDNTGGVSGTTGGKGNLYYSSVKYYNNGKISTRYGTAYTYLLALKTLIDKDVRVINISQNTNRLIGFAASHGNENAVNYLAEQARLAETGLARIIAEREKQKKDDFVICVAAGNSNDTYYYKDDNAAYGYREEANLWDRIKAFFGFYGEKGDSLASYNNFLNLMSRSDVKDRVIVVGSVGIDESRSSSTDTICAYSKFSNVGERVDVSAPGEDIYSCVPGNQYEKLSGTSMSTPHVAGIAGLIFACNPDLSGPEAKKILCASTVGRYYYYQGSSGLANARLAVENALQAAHKPLERILPTTKEPGLDLCFAVDTTGSMGDDIDNAKENMTRILESLERKTPDHRVALIDYRDFADRTGFAEDYPYKLQLDFSGDDDEITEAIDGLDLGNGGDDEETVYSALMAAVDLNWREDAKKVIIILGDAGPLDPEPETDYTYDDVLTALFNASIAIDYDESDERVTDSLDESLINVYSIGAEADDDVDDFFGQISSDTGGTYSDVDDASEVSDAIIDSIDRIDMNEVVSAKLTFDETVAGKPVDIYQNDKFLYTIQPDKNGAFELEAVEAGSYKWTCPENGAGGSFEIDSPDSEVTAETGHQYWFTPLLNFWNRYRIFILILYLLAFILLVSLPIAFAKAGSAINERAAGGRTAKGRPAGMGPGSPQGPGGAAKPARRPARCPHCGTKLGKTDKFCGKCGRKIEP